MEKKLKILHLEDLKSDSELVDRQLKKAEFNYESVLVDNRADFIKQLNEYHPDIIISDHSLPSFDSHDALRILKDSGKEIPFILVTATVSEEYAVTVMKEGASDYILKDRLQRLPTAIISALERQKLERDRKFADDELRASEKKYRLLFDENPLAMWIVKKENQMVIEANRAALSKYQYTLQEFQQKPFPGIIEAGPEFQIELPSTRSGITFHQRKDGTEIFAEIISHDIDFDGEKAEIVMATDITEQVLTEIAFIRHRDDQKKLLAETGIKAQEKEREEIGKELHDNINQLLASSRLYIESSIVEKDPDFLAEMLEKSLSTLDKAIREIRTLSHKLVAPSLGHTSLGKAIQGLINNFDRVTNLQLSFEVKNFDEDLVNKDIKLICYRIVQEQINNILKHSGAKHGHIKLSLYGASFNLQITDDGRGFDMSEISPGIGLRNIANRAELYDGIVELKSAPGMGCELRVSFPLNQASKEAPEN